MDVLDMMVETFEQLVAGAAMQTGTRAEIDNKMRLYAPVKPNVKIGDLLIDELDDRDVEVERGVLTLASTDFGNVSQVVPADYIGFPVSTTPISGHSHVMRDASITDLAHRNAMITAEVLATVAVRIATDPEVRKALAA